MPVHLDSHTPDIDLTPGTTKSAIVAFLYRHPEYGFKPAEIRDELDIPRGTATTTLNRLHEAGYVGKTADSYYHALDDHEGVRRYVASLDQLHRMFGHRREDRDTTRSDGSPADAGSGVSDAEVEAELAELEADIRRDG